MVLSVLITWHDKNKTLRLRVFTDRHYRIVNENDDPLQQLYWWTKYWIIIFGIAEIYRRKNDGWKEHEEWKWEWGHT